MINLVVEELILCLALYIFDTTFFFFCRRVINGVSIVQSESYK